MVLCGKQFARRTKETLLFLINCLYMNVAVIGAGPAGMTAAYELAKSGINVEVFESTAAPGGLAKTINLWGQKVDLGPHRFFSTDPRVNKLWLEVVGSDYSLVDRMTRIFYKQNLFRYPLQPLDVLSKIGIMEAVRCNVSFAKEKISKDRPGETFEDWVVGRFGKRLYEIFFKTYSEKLWGLPCEEIDSDFARQRIKKFNFQEAVKSAFANSGSNKHRTLVDQFAYPWAGTGSVYKRMAKSVEKKGGHIFCERPVQGLFMTEGRVKGIIGQGEIKLYDHVVSTMPLTLLVQTMQNIPSRVRTSIDGLTFRNTILVYLRVADPDLFPDNWIYIHDKNLRVGRVTNFRNWIPNLNGEESDTILCLEYWCNNNDEFWQQTDQDLISLASKEIKFTNLIGEAQIVDGHVVRLPRCYPIYKHGYKELLKPIKEFLTEFSNLTVIGRYGSFKYNNQDHSILMGLLAADNIIHGATNDLWNVNSDYEYQESSYISKTGLELR